MKLLLPLCLLALLAAAVVAAPTVDFDDGGESEQTTTTEVAESPPETQETSTVTSTSSGDDSDDCSGTKTVTKVLGGKEISQVIQQIRSRGRCIWVLEGGTPAKYVDAERCSSCWTRGTGIMCNGPALAMSMVCRLERGPDCQLHTVDGKDPTKPCVPRRPPMPVVG